ncbi:arsenate reductase (glutaredoxin) [Marinospirillum insulare]|uniref:Arsenate reductase n=1 Tax=Marinospirillum insulare TaxID=217169 RepID=A0ABQ6A0J6_9GAMM|nr:arsenate reductase (glutaredoxin) [Marinospirillum insulare]GLR63768.1 arsenate reductase [Marinospirillum insulare]
MSLVLFHNPRCSKSRQALQLLEEKGVQPEIRKYLEAPLTIDELTDLLAQLGKKPAELIRQGEDLYKELKLGAAEVTEEALIQAMVDHPKLIERPILSNGKEARIGRPPEQVLELI